MVINLNDGRICLRTFSMQKHIFLTITSILILWDRNPGGRKKKPAEISSSP